MPPPSVALLCVNKLDPLNIKVLLVAYSPPPWQLHLKILEHLQLPKRKVLLPPSMSLLLLTPSAVPVLFSNVELIMLICSIESMNSANFCMIALGGLYSIFIPRILCIPHEVNTR